MHGIPGLGFLKIGNLKMLISLILGARTQLPKKRRPAPVGSDRFCDLDRASQLYIIARPRKFITASSNMSRPSTPTVQSITISEYILHRLAEIGLKDIFGVPGDFNLSEQPQCDCS